MSVFEMAFLVFATTIFTASALVAWRMSLFFTARTKEYKKLKEKTASRMAAFRCKQEKLIKDGLMAAQNLASFLSSLGSRKGGEVASESSQKSAQSAFDSMIERTSEVPWDAFFHAGNVLSAYTTMSGDFHAAAERYLNLEFESTGDLAADIAARLQPDALSRLFGPESESLDGWVAGLKGHIGEQKAEHLLDIAGLDVALPELGNEPGFDLIVEGLKVQVKTVGNFSEVAEHLSIHEGIPVIFNADAIGIPDGIPVLDASEFAELIHGGATDFGAVALEGLSAEDATDVASDGLGAATGSVEMSIPFVTIGLSSLREIKLLTKGHTDFGTAAKNIGIDAAAKGGGAFAGGKAGALIGTAFAPGIGTAIGAAIGGIAGAMLGGMGAKAIKESGANDAKKELSTSLASMSQRIEIAASWPVAAIKKVGAEYRVADRALTLEGRNVISEGRSALSDLHKRLSNEIQISLRNARVAVESAAKRVGVWAVISNPQTAGEASALALCLAEEHPNTNTGESSDFSLFPILLVDSEFLRVGQIMDLHVHAVKTTMQQVTSAMLGLQRAAAQLTSTFAQKASEYGAREGERAQQEMLSAFANALEPIDRAIVEMRKANLGKQAEAMEQLKSKLESESNKLQGSPKLRAA